MLLILVGLLIWTNVRLARKKGRNTWAWGFITFAAFFLGFCLLGSMYILMIYRGQMTREALTAYLIDAPLASLMISMLGVGGALIVRFILERSKANEME